ncbi:hypothetical protein ACO2Q9_02800 [Variovorax sp. VNK109]|uniref:DUF7940 domain-containing protein n=1 Tax=Variovorax sp. VNK109 TaxID=3400919 RepID=UPI003C0EABB3
MVPRLIPEWRKAWRFSSVRAAALLAVLSMAQAELLPYLQPLLPAKVWPWVTAGVALLIIVLRVIAQPKLEEERRREQ